MTDISAPRPFHHVIILPGRPPVMLDRDIAEIYGTETKRINEAARRNPERFPPDFCFQLTKEEMKDLMCQGVAFQWLQNVRYLPHAYTMKGIRSLLTCLRSPRIKALAIGMGFGDMVVTYVENDCMETIINSVAGITDYRTQ